MLNNRCHNKTSLRLASQAGFTLVELMISLTVVSIAIAAAFAMAFSLMDGFRGHRTAVEVESTARIVLDIMATGTRSASPGLVGGSVYDTCQGAFTSTVVVMNSTTGPDELRVIHAIGGALASTIQDHNVISNGTLNVVDNSTFEKDIYVPAIIIDPIAGKGHLLEVMAPSTNLTQLLTRIPLGCAGNAGLENYTAGSLIVPAVQMWYRVEAPFLYVDPDGLGPQGDIVMAGGIEDLQIAVAVESDGDTSTITEIGLAGNDDEWHNNFAGPGLLDAPAPLVETGGWSALRITIVGLAYREQKNSLASALPAVEDRLAGPADFIRRRAYSTTVGLRNFSAGN